MEKNTNNESSVADDMKTIEAVRNSLAKTDDGKVRQTIANAIYVLENDPLLKDAIKRNELAQAFKDIYRYRL